MAEQRQPRLFRRRPRRRDPSEAASGDEPPRLALGEPESLAFKRAQEERRERRERERSKRERQERMSAAQRRRWERQQDDYPTSETVVGELRRVITSPEHGLPPKRERIELLVREALTSRFPGVPREYIRDVFDRALDAGLVRYRGRRWEWQAEALPRREEVSAGVLREIGHFIASYTAVLRVQRERFPLGYATICLIEDVPHLLTARHVWDGALETGRGLELILFGGCIVDIDIELVDPIILGGEIVAYGEWGPDLALLRLPGMLRWEIHGQGKRLFPLSSSEGPMLAEGRVWLLSMDPCTTGLPPQVAVEERSRTSDSGLDLDYLDVRYSRSAETPISGRALFSAPVDAVGGWDGTLELEGLVYYEQPDCLEKLRCHGRRSIDACVEMALSELRTD